MNLSKIPKILFQTWKTKNITDGLKSLANTWCNLNQNYKYNLFDDEECLIFIKTHFDLNIYNAYCRIIPGAFKADFWRYCVLYIYGGVYVDIDTICLNSIDNFLNDDIEFMTCVDLNNCPYYGKYNLFNAFIASVPKHPILLECINRIVHNIENNILPFSNLDFSGPGVLGQSVNNFMGNSPTDSFVGKEGTHNKNIKLLHFSYGTEYISDVNTNAILFQNKNGNAEIQKIYDNEPKPNFVDWGKCKNPIKPLVVEIDII